MGKRSNFERREADFYTTPRAAVVPLIPYLRGIRSFAEPCAGDGDLVRHLEEFDLRCVYSGDIRGGQDALALDDYGAADVIISNPPWSRELMHRLIAHFLNIKPTWLLLDADWPHTKQAAPYLPHCSDIVAIGRVKWIEGSKHTRPHVFALKLPSQEVLENCADYVILIRNDLRQHRADFVVVIVVVSPGLITVPNQTDMYRPLSCPRDHARREHIDLGVFSSEPLEGPVRQDIAAVPCQREATYPGILLQQSPHLFCGPRPYGVAIHSALALANLTFAPWIISVFPIARSF